MNCSGTDAITKGQSASRAEQAEAVREAIRTCWRTHSDREIAEATGASPTTVGKHRRALEEAGDILPRLKSGHPM